MTAARVRPAIRSKIGIPLFAKKPSHPSVPLGSKRQAASIRSATVNRASGSVAIMRS